ncbi:GTPase activation, GAP [Glarea lozoyensis ATCC 20868]|uniref:GTPase activation, GAP n=1 Tax=Glarea lozoyensis (strain ATCC 20868 / MF5171) TaxID=1116229 RepID=S3CSA5_GLAL2|nr:GTPase activation, GAP [Glarea lozoyensis ATCC 20868]EPE28565.1 GTPase activation, GAP [Glarea lozoyensis ATCC 20868]
MDGRPYNETYGKDGALQNWQRNATETLARGLGAQAEPQRLQRIRPGPNSARPERVVTPEQPEDFDNEFSIGGSTVRSVDHPSSTQASPRSIPGGEKPRDRRQGLVFQDSYSTDSLEGRTGPPVSFHSRPRTRTTSGVEEHKRNRSTSTNVSRSRHRIGSVHSTSSSVFHNAEARGTNDASNSLGFPSIASRPTQNPQLQKSNSVKSGRQRLVKRGSRPTSPLTAMSDVPSVDSLPFPIATSDANKILMLMQTLCGRMRGEVEYQTDDAGLWISGICYIDDIKGSLMHEGDGSGLSHAAVISDLRGCRVRPIVSQERRTRCLEISHKAQGIEMNLIPVVKAEFDLWLAALLCWQQVRKGTLPATSTKAAHSLGDRPNPPRRSSTQPRSSSASVAGKEGNIIKVAKCLLWDKGAPSSPRAIVRRPSTRDLKSPARTWRKVSCILQDNGEFKLLTENDINLLSIIQLSQLSRCAVQKLDRSVLDQDFCIAIYPRYTASSTQLSIFRPVYIALESRLLYEVWFCLLNAFSVPEIYGVPHSDDSTEFDIAEDAEVRSSPDMFRIEKSLKLRVVEAKMRKQVAKPESFSQSGRLSVKQEADLSIGEYFAEVVLDGEVRARTITKADTRNPFWREDYEFQSLSPQSPRLMIVLKRVDTTTQHHGFLSANIHGPDQADEILCGTIEISVDKFERGQDNEAWWPVLDNSQEKIGEIFLKIRYDELVVLLAKDYEPLSLLLHNFGSGLTDQIAQAISRNLRGLSETLMNIFQVSGHAYDWLAALVEDEIDGISKETPNRRVRWSRRIGSNESYNSVGDREQTVRDIGKSLQGEANLLFRGNSLFTQAMDFHMRRLGKEYLEEVLAEKVVEINKLNPDCEVDPSRLGHGEDINKNWKLLISLTTEIWDGIAGSSARCPPELRQILKYIRAVAEDRYGDFFRTVSFTSVSGFLFLRFLCPALLNPKLFGLLRDHPQAKAQRTFTLIAKSLQALANLSTFGQKESWMEPMNRFLHSHRQGLKDFIDAICSISSERNNFSLPASYSTPITILARLPPTSREGFPSLPYLIDHARNFAGLIKLWLDSTSNFVLLNSFDGDLAEFNKMCLELQRRADECRLNAESGDSTDQLSLQWDDLADEVEGITIQDSPNLTNYPLEPSPTSFHSPQWSEFTTTITGGIPPGSSGSLRDRDKRERQSFWESTFGRERESKIAADGSNASPPSRGQSRNGNKGDDKKRGFLSGLRRKGTKDSEKEKIKQERSVSIAESVGGPSEYRERLGSAAQAGTPGSSSTGGGTGMI